MIGSGAERATWRNTGRWMAGLLACGALGWWAFVRGVNVPLLSLVDLGFHELGHLLTYWLPAVVTAMMGSINQVLVPLALAGYFIWIRRDRLAGALCLAWAATSAQNASVYIADAPFQRLPLIGGEHDWAFVLGPEHFDVLNRAGVIAAWVKGFGLVLLLTGTSLCVAGLLGFLSDPSSRLPTGGGRGGGSHAAGDRHDGGSGDWGVLDARPGPGSRMEQAGG